jgi:hypothetical protein
VPLALIYDGEDGGSDVNLEGAPVAFAKERLSYVGDCKTISTNFPRDLSTNCRSRVEAYYSKHANVRSFISLPIPGEDGLLGTLNICRNSINITGGESGAAKVAAFLSRFSWQWGSISRTSTLPSCPRSPQRRRREARRH